MGQWVRCALLSLECSQANPYFLNLSIIRMNFIPRPARMGYGARRGRVLRDPPQFLARNGAIVSRSRGHGTGRSEETLSLFPPYCAIKMRGCFRGRSLNDGAEHAMLLDVVGPLVELLL